MKIILWFILLAICWPLAIAFLFLYPIIWLLLLPFKIVGLTVKSVFELFYAIISFPARILR